MRKSFLKKKEYYISFVRESDGKFFSEIFSPWKNLDIIEVENYLLDWHGYNDDNIIIIGFFEV